MSSTLSASCVPDATTWRSGKRTGLINEPTMRAQGPERFPRAAHDGGTALGHRRHTNLGRVLRPADPAYHRVQTGLIQRGEDLWHRPEDDVHVRGTLLRLDAAERAGLGPEGTAFEAAVEWFAADAAAHETERSIPACCPPRNTNGSGRKRSPRY